MDINIDLPEIPEVFDIPMGISLNQEFATLEDVEAKIETIRRETFVQMSRTDSRTIKSSRKSIKRYLDENLKFYLLKYACVYGGKKYKSKGRGIRNAKLSKKQCQCPVHVTFRISQCGGFFQVISLNTGHTHKVLPIEVCNKRKNKWKLPAQFSVGSKYCRACLQDVPQMNSLFDKTELQFTLAEILKDTIPTEVSENDGLSPYICKSCTKTITSFHEFKLAFQQNEKHLKLLFAYPGSTKTESNEDDSKGYFEEIIIKAETPEDMEGETLSQDVKSDDSMDEDFKENENVGQQGWSTDDVKKDENCNENKEKSTENEEKEIENKCKACHETFEDEATLLQHRKVTHKPCICEHCGKTFRRMVDLLEHSVTHSSVRNYVCQVCGKAFKMKKHLNRHTPIHTNPRSIVCEACGQRFNHQEGLRVHFMIKHIGSRNYKCSFCGSRFPLKATLNKHVLRKHSTERRNEHRCDLCEMAYKDVSSLRRHVEVKHAENVKKWKCIMCDKDYTTNTNLRKHHRKHHA